jgi:excisionase family DNA binding protein
MPSTDNVRDATDDVAVQFLPAQQELSHNGNVSLVASGTALTTTEAANLLGMSPTHLSQLCDEGSIVSSPNGKQRGIPSAEVQRILVERNSSRIGGRRAAESTDQRRLNRAIRAIELQEQP